MKKKLLLLVFAITLIASQTQAQVPNPGFENLNHDSTISHWGNIYLWAVIVDSTGSHFDSIVFDQQFYAKTSDAHTGNWAMEMRNAYDFTANSGIAGSVSATDDTVFSGWSSFNLISIPAPPTELSFYYKYFPLNNDSAEARLTVFDSMSNQLGEAVVVIGGTYSNYTYVQTPVVYTTPGVASFAVMNFKASRDPYNTSLGTRFLIDDVSLNGTAGINDLGEEDLIRIYPNPSKGDFNILLDKGISKDVSLTTYNLLGESIYSKEITAFPNGPKQISLNAPPGIYTIKITDGDKNYVKKLIIN